MMRMPMVSLAKSPAEVKEEQKMYDAPAIASKPSVPEYPYGACISLEDETLEKIGLAGDLPAVGEMIHFGAIAKVTSASMNERIGPDGVAKQCCRIELQITDMGVLSADPADNEMAKSAARRERFYGKSDDDED